MENTWPYVYSIEEMWYQGMDGPNINYVVAKRAVWDRDYITSYIVSEIHMLLVGYPTAHMGKEFQKHEL